MTLVPYGHQQRRRPTMDQSASAARPSAGAQTPASQAPTIAHAADENINDADDLYLNRTNNASPTHSGPPPQGSLAELLYPRPFPPPFPGAPPTFRERHIQIDPFGDRTISIPDPGGQLTFKVCSRTLSLGSPWMRSFFDGDIAHVPSTLSDVWGYNHFKVWAMDPMLRVLHHQRITGLETTSAKVLAEFMMHCKLYDCARTLGPWAVGWAQQCRITSAEDVGYLFLVAWLGHSREIEEIAFSHAQMLSIAEISRSWPANPLLKIVADKRFRDLTTHISKKLGVVVDLVHSAVREIRATDNDEHLYWVCAECGVNTGDTPPSENDCCKSRMCDGEARVEGLKALLLDSDVLSQEAIKETSCPKDIMDALKETIEGLHFICPYTTTCPFHIEVMKMTTVLADM